jgi:ABC-type phosphate/phosphonate transport system permease subunit
MNEQQQSLQELHHIKQMMERSSRFISLSGLSGVSAGIFALLGAWFAVKRISIYAHGKGIDYETLLSQLIIIAAFVLIAAFITAFVFTYLRSRRNGVSIWVTTTYRMLINLSIPLIAVAFFLIRLL